MQEHTAIRKNEWALILGASSGLGLASAEKLAQHGYNLILIHRDRRSDLPKINSSFKAMKALGITVHSYNIDATNLDKRNNTIDDIKTQLAETAKIKVLIHSIAKGNLKPMWSETEHVLGNADFHLTIEAMAISLYDWTRKLIEQKMLSTDARIIAFTSEGNTKAWENYAAVSAAKATLEALVRNMALEFAAQGIKVNCVQAGITDTDSFKQIPGSDVLREHAINRNPFHRLTKPEDVANVVYLLTRDEAKWITGSIIKADGGESLR